MKFPAFSLPDQEGRIRRLEDFEGRRLLVIYFYPMDNTPGCTAEAKEFTELLEEFHRLEVEVIGVSTQSPESHSRFCSKHGLRLILLSDREKVLSRELGILRGLFGTAKRTTYLVRPDGEVLKVWENVKPRGHAREVLEYIRAHH